MKKNIFTLLILVLIQQSCIGNKTFRESDYQAQVNLDANNRENTEIKSIYNSIIKNEATLLINKKKIPNEQVQAVLDTLTADNYTMNVNKNERIIELISK
jgi:hypothetical protein